VEVAVSEPPPKNKAAAVSPFKKPLQWPGSETQEIFPSLVHKIGK